MQAQRIWWLVILSMTGIIEAAAQEPRKVVLASLGRTPIVPVEKRAGVEKDVSFGHPGSGLSRLRLPLADRFIEEKRPFATETRLPLLGLWNGRVELSCVHQRHNFRALHPAYLHSTRYQASTLYHVGAPLLRSRTNYGLTLSLHFGRRGSEPTPMPPAHSGERR
jgi:hypothetical protein